MGDGKELYNSELIKGNKEIADINVNVSDIYEIQLIVDDGGDGVENDLVNWVNPVLTLKENNLAWDSISSVEFDGVQNNKYLFRSENNSITFEILKSNAIRVKYENESDTPNKMISYVLNKDEEPKSKHSIKDTGEYFLLSTDSLHLRIYKAPFKLALHDVDNNKMIVENERFRHAINNTNQYLSLSLPDSSTNYYGCGLQFQNFNLKGKSIINWAKYVNVPSSSGQVELTIPMTYTTSGFAFILMNSFKNTFHFEDRLNSTFEVELEDGKMDFILIKEDLKTQVETYFKLTGYPALLPKYVLGTSFRGYGAFGVYGEEAWYSGDYNKYFKEFEERDFPVDFLGTEPGYTRIAQLMAFNSTINHNEWAGGQLPWERSDTSFEIIKEYYHLHYSLFPYLYSYYGAVRSNKLGIIRPLVLQYENDAKTYNIDDEYMLGENLLIVPIMDYKTANAEREIYFPKYDNWIDLESGELIQGGTKIKKVYGLDQYPVFIREGAIIPMAKNISNITNAKFDTIDLHIYPGGNSYFLLYEDDGLTQNYKKAEYMETKIVSEKQKDKLIITITRENEGIENDYVSSVFNLYCMTKKPGKVLLNNKKASWKYTGGRLEMKNIDTKRVSNKIVVNY